MCFIAGIALAYAAPVIFMILIVLILTAYLTYRIKTQKIKTEYLFLPILIIIGYLCMEKQSNIYLDFPKGMADFEGVIYDVKESGDGYYIFIRNSIFDKERVMIFTEEKYRKGSLVNVKGEYEGIKKPTNPGQFDSRTYYNSLKVIGKVRCDKITVINEKYNLVYYAAARTTEFLEHQFNKICNEKYASVFNAMILGRKDELDTDIKELFSAGGISHILAISGLHISLIGMAMYRLLQRMGANYLASMLLSSAFILFYGIMTGNGVSTVRAFIMFVVYVYANVVGKTYDMISAAALAAIVSLIDSPLLIFNCSFLLSYMAVAGIVYVYGAFAKQIKMKNKFVEGFFVSLSIQITTIPITLFYFYRLPLFSVFFNLIVVPLMTLVMSSAIGGCIVSIFFVGMGRFLVAPAVYSVKLFEWICQLNKKISWSVYTAGCPQLIKIFIYYILVIGVLYLVNHCKKGKTIAALPVIILLFLIKLRTCLTITFADVGQGDSIFVLNKNGTSILIDCGSSSNRSVYEYTLKPMLYYYGCDKLDYVIVTHTDNDHISGIKNLMSENEIKINQLMLPLIGNKDEEYENLTELAKKNNTYIDYIYKGVSIKLHKLKLQCINPEKGHIYEDKNDGSTTLFLIYQDFSALLTGDITAITEDKLLRDELLFKDINVLKAAHHGSRYSNSDDFVSFLSPKEVVVSCGAGNSYGHPHIEALEVFSIYSKKIKRTDKDGAIIYKI